MKIYVGNLVYNMTEAELGDLFSSFGEVKNVRIIHDHFTRQSKNFGYVEMSHPVESQEAITQLDGKAINDRNLVVKPAHSNSEYIGSN